MSSYIGSCVCVCVPICSANLTSWPFDGLICGICIDVTYTHCAFGIKIYILLWIHKFIIYDCVKCGTWPTWIHMEKQRERAKQPCSKGKKGKKKNRTHQPRCVFVGPLPVCLSFRRLLEKQRKDTFSVVYNFGFGVLQHAIWILSTFCGRNTMK